MYYVIHCGGMPFDGDTIKDQSLGGSESAAYYLAKELAARGHSVSVFTNKERDKTQVFDDVKYSWSGQVTEKSPLGDRFQYYAENTPHDVLIIQRHPLAFSRQYASGINLLWTHDLALFRYAQMIEAQLWNVDGILTVSEFHKKQTQEVYGIKPENIFAIRNGVDLELFKGLEPTKDLLNRIDFGRDKKYLLYSSRPERGLDNLVKPDGIMERLGDEYHLFVCTYDNHPPQMAGLYGYLNARIEALPNATSLGSLTKKDLASLMNVCDLLVYPTTFEEVSCITAMEAMAAVLPMVTSEHAALPETCEGSGSVLLPLKAGSGVDIGLFVDEIKDITSDGARRVSLYDGQSQARKGCTWARACDLLEEAVSECYSWVTVDNIAQDKMKCSDIMRLDAKELDDGVIKDNLSKELKLYDFIGKPMSDHYNWRDDDHYETIMGNTSIDRFNGQIRCVEARRLIGEYIENKGKEVTVLEWGGFVGHIACGIKREFGDDVSVCCSDVDTKALKHGAKMANDNDLDVSYLSQSELKGTFDVIVVEEVLEHVVNPISFFNDVFKYAHNETLFIITTPYGPWEYDSFITFYPSREHLWHFSRDDIKLMFGGFDGYKLLCLPGGRSRIGEAIGHYFYSFIAGENNLNGGILRKLTERKQLGTYTASESVSLCMIVKDGESSIKRCLDSVIDLVDEVVIGIDAATADRTRDLLNDYFKDQLKTRFISVSIIDIKPAVETGFDEARNAVISKATGDWILWLDADEVLYGLKNINKYLRPNQYDCYLIKQQHFSVEPPGVLRTDFPSKLYRRSDKVKFYGVVHEHPGTNENEGPGKVMIIPDVVIKHDGYETEAIRRERFQRNVKLMIRDREKYPDRILGIFLWLRDISHMCKFEMEQNGNRLTDDLVFKAKRGIELWETLLEKADIRMLDDALEYYTLFVTILGGGFEMSSGIAATKGNGHSPNASSKIKNGRFLNTEHAKAYIDKSFQKEVTNYDSRYF